MRRPLPRKVNLADSGEQGSERASERPCYKQCVHLYVRFCVQTSTTLRPVSRFRFTAQWIWFWRRCQRRATPPGLQCFHPTDRPTGLPTDVKQLEHKKRKEIVTHFTGAFVKGYEVSAARQSLALGRESCSSAVNQQPLIEAGELPLLSRPPASFRASFRLGRNDAAKI